MALLFMDSGDVLPRLARDDVADRKLTDIETSSQFSLERPTCGVRLADLMHLLGREAGATVALTGLQCTSALLHHVSQVVSTRPEEQMRWAYTAPVVAVVANEQALRNRAVSDFIGRSMSVDRPPIQSASSVTVREEASGPEPAAGCFSDVCPERGNGVAWSAHLVSR